MDNVYLWNTTLFKNSYDNIEIILEKIRNGEILSLNIKESYRPGDDIYNVFENIANEKNYSIIYVDKDHPFIETNLIGSFINKSFFEDHKKEISEAFIEQIRNNKKNYYVIYDYFFNNNVLDILLDKEDPHITFVNVDLTDDQIKRIKDKYIDAFIEKNGHRERISNRYVIGYYTINDLKNKKNLSFQIDFLDNFNIEPFKMLNDSCIISINNYGDMKITEEETYQKIRSFIEKLEKLNKKIIIKFDVEKRSTFTKIFKDFIPNNVDLVIKNDLNDYSFKEYMDEEKRLEDMVAPIKALDLSPLEKYLAVYNIVKQFKEYKENDEETSYSRYLRYILDNDYIVCVGFAKLLEVLCDKVGINCKSLGVGVDTSYDDGYTKEEKPVIYNGHARNIVSIDDDKYNVHGLFVSDSTWDNDLTTSLLNNALMPFDKMRVSSRMFFYSFSEPILDIHNFQEFNDQVNFLLKHKLNFYEKHNFGFNNNTQRILKCYHDVIDDILKTIEPDPKAEYFIHKNYLCETEQDYIDLLTELGNYLLTRVNKKVDSNIIVQASTYTDKLLNKSNANSDDYVEKIKQNYDSKEDYLFPYDDYGKDHDLKPRTR